MKSTMRVEATGLGLGHGDSLTIGAGLNQGPSQDLGGAAVEEACLLVEQDVVKFCGIHFLDIQTTDCQASTCIEDGKQELSS